MSTPQKGRICLAFLATGLLVSIQIVVFGATARAVVASVSATGTLHINASAQPANCSLSLAKRLAARPSTPAALRREIAADTPYYGGIADVTCVKVTGNQEDLEFNVSSGGSAGFIAWAVFRHSTSGWKFAAWNSGPGPIPIGFLDGNVVVTVGVYETGNPLCCPTGGYYHHEYHWNGVHFIEIKSWHSTTVAP